MQSTEMKKHGTFKEPNKDHSLLECGEVGGKMARVQVGEGKKVC